MHQVRVMSIAYGKRYHSLVASAVPPYSVRHYSAYPDVFLEPLVVYCFWGCGRQIRNAVRLLCLTPGISVDGLGMRVRAAIESVKVRAVVNWIKIWKLSCFCETKLATELLIGICWLEDDFYARCTRCMMRMWLMTVMTIVMVTTMLRSFTCDFSLSQLLKTALQRPELCSSCCAQREALMTSDSLQLPSFATSLVLIATGTRASYLLICSAKGA
eukprot:2821644-Amphidinium_carterae.1